MKIREFKQVVVIQKKRRRMAKCSHISHLYFIGSQEHDNIHEFNASQCEMMNNTLRSIKL
jgi:hypothetical protein